MSEKASPEHSKTKKPKSLRLYATRVFEESYVSVLSSAVNTSSIGRRIFKVIAFFLCLTGFLYQASVFLSAVFKYPTTVDTVVLRPDTYSIPAYTFCNNNGISKRNFCEKFPDKCEVPSEEFCKEYKKYCGKNGTRVPKAEYFNYGYYSYIEKELLVELNEKPKDFVLKDGGNITGPYLRRNLFPNFKHFLCYSVNDRVNNELDAPEFTPDRLRNHYINAFRLRIREDEIFLPEFPSGFLFALHSPFEAVNPFKTGIFMKPRRKYILFVTMEEEILLKSPYDTDCTNYTEIWERNGRRGPRSQEMCKHNCMSDVNIQCYNCIDSLSLYPRPERFCKRGDYESPSCPPNHKDLLEQCAATKCKADCRKVKYYVNVQERLIENFGSREKRGYDDVHVEIYLEGDQVVQLRHSPKFMFVEAFSNVGGFIGCWLGISLLDATDVFEGLFRVFRYALKKRKYSTEVFCTI